MDHTAHMTDSLRPLRFALPLIALLMVLASCRAAGEPTSSASSPASATASAAATDSPTPEPTDEPSATPEPATPSIAPSPSTTDGGFTIAPNAEADALFLTRDECENVEDGYRLEFPDDWWTNTAFADVQPCRWFSPTFYEVTDSESVPSEIAIVVELVDGGVGWVDEILSRQEGIIGRTQPAVRVEVQGTGAVRPVNLRETAYVVQLGPTPEEGPNLVVRTTTDMGGDYELNVAVLDRIMATMELIGTIQ